MITVTVLNMPVVRWPDSISTEGLNPEIWTRENSGWIKGNFNLGVTPTSIRIKLNDEKLAEQVQVIIAGHVLVDAKPATNGLMECVAFYFENQAAKS